MPSPRLRGIARGRPTRGEPAAGILLIYHVFTFYPQPLSRHLSRPSTASGTENDCQPAPPMPSALDALTAPPIRQLAEPTAAR